MAQLASATHTTLQSTWCAVCILCSSWVVLCAEHKAFDHNDCTYLPDGHCDSPQNAVCNKCAARATLCPVVHSASGQNVQCTASHPNGCANMATLRLSVEHASKRWHSGVTQTGSTVQHGSKGTPCCQNRWIYRNVPWPSALSLIIIKKFARFGTVHIFWELSWTDWDYLMQS